MGPGLLVALTLPGLVLLLVALAVLEQQRTRELRRDDLGDGAPPRERIDLDGGVAYL